MLQLDEQRVSMADGSSGIDVQYRLALCLGGMIDDGKCKHWVGKEKQRGHGVEV